MKTYGSTVLKIGLFVYIMLTCSFAEKTDVAPSPTGLSVRKEVLRVTACALVIAVKSLNKL